MSLVVYFIYREVEYLRGKVDKLEKELKEKSYGVLEEKSHNVLEDKSTQPKNINKPILALPKKPTDIQESPKTEIVLNTIPNDQVESGRPSPKVISLDMSPSKNTNPNTELAGFESGIKLTSIVTKAKSQSESDSSSESSSSKHLAIYSNDNEQYDETQNSLLESIESHKLELNFDYADKPIPNIDTNVNELINMVTSDHSEKNESVSLDSELMKSDGISIGGISINNDKLSSSSDTDLEKKKLPEIKKIAETKKISLTKKVNGQQKPKNKQELINEIIGSKNK